MKRASSLLALTLLLCCPGLPAAAATPSKGKGVSWISGKSFPFEAYSSEDIFLRIFAEKEIKNNSLTKRYAEKGIKATAYVCDQAFAVIKKRPNAPRERVSSVLSSKLIEKVAKDREFFNSAWISVGAFPFVCLGVILPSDLYGVVTKLQQIDRTKFSKFTHAAFLVAWNQTPSFYKDNKHVTSLTGKQLESQMRSFLIALAIESGAKQSLKKEAEKAGYFVCREEKSDLMLTLEGINEELGQRRAATILSIIKKGGDLGEVPLSYRTNELVNAIAGIQLSCNISFSTQELRSLVGKNYVALPK